MPSTETLAWAGFGAIVLTLLVLDLGVFHRRAHTIEVREAVRWVGFWVSLAIAFNVAVLVWRGPEKGLEFLTGYLIEYSLSVDNIFVFLVIFSYFAVPGIYQHRLLFWGILGAIVMRGLFIAAGITLIERFHFLIYIFGAFLVFTGIRLALERGRRIEPERNPVLRLVRRFVPVTEDYVEGRFFVRQGARLVATPMFIVLIVVESTDVIFAVDSIPAILAITRDPFIVYSSNVFAILGLRALYFALAGIMPMFRFLHYGLAAILIFVGIKMLVSDLYEMPVGIALGAVGTILAVSVILSILRPEPDPAVHLGAQAGTDPEPQPGTPNPDH
ncbi:MAG: TerC family protein [Anaerolineae bacterium]